jgi:hypothetical protein
MAGVCFLGSPGSARGGNGLREGELVVVPGRDGRAGATSIFFVLGGGGGGTEVNLLGAGGISTGISWVGIVGIELG